MIRIDLLVRSLLFLQLPHSLVRLRVRILSLQLLCLLLLRVLRCLLSHLLQGGSPQDLPHLAHAVRGPPPSRRQVNLSQFVSRDSALTRLAELLYEVCPHSRPLLDESRPPQCEFEGWFGQPEASPARPHFRLYPCVAEVESEVTAKAGSLARRSKPLSSILTSRFHRHAVADLPNYASSSAVNPSFSQLPGAKAVGSKHWGSISFSEMRS